MTSKEAIERMKYRITTAVEIAGRGEEGKAFEDMELAIQALENQEIFLKMLIDSESDFVCIALTDRCEDWCEEHCRYSSTQRECWLKYVDTERGI